MKNVKGINVELAAIMPVFEEKLKSGGSVCFGPKGVSMMPLIRQDKDTVVISPVNGSLKKYDIPLYRRKSGQFVLHRVVGMKNGKYVMCGDNQYVREYGISDEQIIGVVTEIKRPEGTVKTTDADYIKYSKKRVRRQYLRWFLSRVKKKLARILHK